MTCKLWIFCWILRCLFRHRDCKYSSVRGAKLLTMHAHTLCNWYYKEIPANSNTAFCFDSDYATVVRLEPTRIDDTVHRYADLCCAFNLVHGSVLSNIRRCQSLAKRAIRWVPTHYWWLNDRRLVFEWTSHSPDLTSHDYYLWGTLKMCVLN